MAYTHDDASRLIGQMYSGPNGTLGDLAYSYDVNGDRIRTSGSWARALLPASTLSSDYDVTNEQLTFGTVSQTFDANGNLLTQTNTSGTTAYTWDARNQLVGLSGPSVTATFAYDAFGRRITKTVNGSSANFQYDALEVVRETRDGEEANYLRTLEIDAPLTRTDAIATFTYLSDILGSTVALADSNGATATEYVYEPFGATQVSGASVQNAFQFIGRENDGTGLYYYRARYHDSSTGRFVQADQLGVRAGSTNLYAYADNNPLTYIDPLGLSPCVREECTQGPYHELSRKPKSDWLYNTSIAIGPSRIPNLDASNAFTSRGPVPNQLPRVLPFAVYTIKCFWKRKIAITYGYIENCTAICKDACGRASIQHTSAWKTSESEGVEPTLTTMTLDVLQAGWGGSAMLTELFCKSHLKP